ncbi:MAG: energy-coupling factor transporter transmembrane protein EcfT [Acidimicrobiia bacterium]|nr:energy-coupling factor transporter transmembrane protein EcfT [Acidimicrobiia bacterium]
MTTRFHSLAWLAWALAAAAVLQVAPSAVYVAVVLLVAVLVVEVHGRWGRLARAFPFFLTLGAVFGLVRVTIAALTTHGAGQVLFTLPSATLPRLLGGFTVGGTVELEVILRSASEAFAIVGMIAVFGAWNSVVSHDEVLQSVPRAFHELGLIVSVALAFVPATLTSVRATRDADRARTGGAVVKRGRLVRLVVPVLESGMERAVSLSESMDSRGFGHRPPAPTEAASAWLGLGALVALGGAFAALVGRASSTANILGALGVVFTVAAVVVASRASRRVRYRPRRMTRADWSMAVVSALAPLVVGVIAISGDTTLTWEPGRLEIPGFNPVVAVALLTLAAPAAFPPRAALAVT